MRLPAAFRSLGVAVFFFVAAIPSFADTHCWCKVVKADCGDCNDICPMVDYGQILDFSFWDLLHRQDRCNAACSEQLPFLSDVNLCAGLATKGVPMPWGGDIQACAKVGTGDYQIAEQRALNCSPDDGKPPVKKFWKRTFFDDFRGKPDTSAHSAFCYDQLKPQCHIWEGAPTHDCDTPYNPSNPGDPGFIPPLRQNWIAVLNVMDPSQSWSQQSFANIRSRYSQLLNDRLGSLDKCTWTLFDMLDVYATDYQGNYAARMDPSQVQVHPEGKGYLELSAVAAPVSADCVYGGDVAGPNCEIFGFSANQVVPGVTYWVDTDPRWPGVYYAQVQGQCTHGGVAAPPNCQVVGLPAGLLESGVTYWVDANPSWPGVYYANSAKYRCKDNILYQTSGVQFKDLVCPILNGAVLSVNFPPVPPTTTPRGWTQQYGRFEAKLRVPKGVGSFPAAWMMPTEGEWPYSGEIDLLEARDAANETYQTYHNGKCLNAILTSQVSSFLDSGGHLLCGKANTPLASYVPKHIVVPRTVKQRTNDEFWTRDHLFAVEWTEHALEFYINNVRTNYIGIGTRSDLEPTTLGRLGPENFPIYPFYWILDHATYVPPAARPGFQKQSYLIDYVANYARCEAPRDFCPCGGTFTDGIGCTLAPGEVPSCQVVLNGQVYPSECQERGDCIAGGVKAGPNCWVYGFQNPQVIPGVPYWVDANPSWPGVYYQPVAGHCPYGGNGPGPNCQLVSFPAGVLVPNVSYWVDTDPRWPGVYYAQVSSQCTHGGQPSGPNCQVKAFTVPSPYVTSAVHYWVDPDPRWPGVYYQPIAGYCPYGGNGPGPNCQLVSFGPGVLETGVNYWVDTDPRWPGVYYLPDFRE